MTPEDSDGERPAGSGRARRGQPVDRETGSAWSLIRATPEYRRARLHLRPSSGVRETVSEDVRKGTVDDGAAAERADDQRKTRSIRFSESEWEEVRDAALAHDLPAAEFVRKRILALVRGSESAGTPAIAPALTPLIERMFRYSWFLATEKRNEMIREGREEELERLVGEARALQESLSRDAPD